MLSLENMNGTEPFLDKTKRRKKNNMKNESNIKAKIINLSIHK